MPLFRPELARLPENMMLLLRPEPVRLPENRIPQCSVLADHVQKFYNQRSEI